MTVGGQRERLCVAAMSVVSERGYETTRISDLVQAAGVSRNTFYRHFESRDDCVLAAIDIVVDAAATGAVSAYRRQRGSCSLRLGAAFAALIDLVIAHPEAARLLCVEAYAAGPAAVARAERLEQLLERMVADALGGSPEPSPVLTRAILGGLKQVVHSRVRLGREHELRRLAPEMLRWALSYADTPPDPGTAALGAAGERQVIAHTSAVRPGNADARVRMLDAVAELAVAKGYAAITITEIAERSRVSLTTFYNHFPSKEEALVAAASHGEGLLLAETLPAFRSASSWPLAVRAGLGTFLCFVAAHPAYARLSLLDVYAAGSVGLDWREQAIARSQALMMPGYDTYPRTPPIAAEAVGATIAAMLQNLILAGDPERLPDLEPLVTFVALAPFMGTGAAMDVVSPTGARA